MAQPKIAPASNGKARPSILGDVNGLSREAIEALPAGPYQSWLGTVGLAVAIGLAYFLVARFGLALRASTGTSVFWPAVGISVGALIVWGPVARLPVSAGVVVATAVANLMIGRNAWLAVAFGFVNAGQTLLTTGLIERWFGRSLNFGDVSQVLGFLVASTIGSAAGAIGATIAVGLIELTGSLFTVWRVWCASCLLGIVTVAPVLVGIADALRHLPPRRELIDGAVGVLILAALSAFVTSLPQGPWSTALPVALVVPVLLWVAVRCRPVFAAAAWFVVASAVIWSITFSVGHFGDASIRLADRILAAQTVVLVGALLTLVLAALFADRRRSEVVLKQSTQRLADALTAGQVMAFEWDAVTRQSLRSENAADILGFEQETDSSPCNKFLSHVHSEDRASVKKRIRELSPSDPSYALSFRYVGADNRQVWLEETAKGEFDAKGKLLRIKGLTRDITERKRAEERQQVLAGELDHRVKNALATVSAVVSHTRQGTRSVADFVAALDGRIRSMATTHKLLSSRRWHGVSLTELVRRELAPYATRNNTKIGGPEVTLTAEAVQVVSMVLHELTTNAAKHGALSVHDGQVSVRWHSASNGNADAPIAIEWQETGGPAVQAPDTCGYGMEVIRDVIPYELGGRVDLTFPADGLCCRFEIPVEWLSNGTVNGAGRPLHGVS